MKVKELKEKLNEFPDDMGVLIYYGEQTYDGNIILKKKDLYHCNYTTKWQSNIDSYSEYDEPCVYKDDVNGKIVAMKIPMEKKEFIVFEC